MQVTAAAKGQGAFFRTNNGGYGTNWESQAEGAAAHNVDPNEVPQYRELVSLTIRLCRIHEQPRFRSQFECCREQTETASVVRAS